MLCTELSLFESILFFSIKKIKINAVITIENEINTEAEGEVSGYNNKISELERIIKSETEKVTPLREKNIESLSKIQRLNLELQSLDEENTRTQEEIENIKVIADGNGEFTRMMGMLVDKHHLGFGQRSWRYAMIVDNGNVEKMWVEPGINNAGEDMDPYGETTPENVIEYLKRT